MFKKFAIATATTVAALALAVPAFASIPHFSKPSLTLSNFAHVSNDVNTKANTGDNSISGLKVKGGTITTDVATAGTQIDNAVNSNDSSCGCSTDGKTTLKNVAIVHNDVDTKANTGKNSIQGLKVTGGSIISGAADSTSIVSNVVNTNVVGGTTP